MSEIFEEQDYLYSLKNPRTLITKRKSTFKLGIDSIVFKRPKIWQTFAKEVRNSQPLSILITNIKNFWEIICQCKTWKTCIENLEYTHWWEGWLYERWDGTKKRDGKDFFSREEIAKDRMISSLLLWVWSCVIGSMIFPYW